MKSTDASSTPQWVGACAEGVLSERDRPKRLKRRFDQTQVPMAMLNGDRRIVDANPAARLAVRHSLGELQRLRVDDLTPPDFIPALEEAWSRLNANGVVAGIYEVAAPPGTKMEVVYYAVANCLPGLYLVAFAPLGWSDSELLVDRNNRGSRHSHGLTPRELEILELAAEGRTGPMIAAELVVSPATVRTHFGNIYEKLGVHDRAAAVAKAMRLGLII